eukprot:Clim_evm15s119 gene=Clim_evmTU15s119
MVGGYDPSARRTELIPLSGLRQPLSARDGNARIPSGGAVKPTSRWTAERTPSSGISTATRIPSLGQKTSATAQRTPSVGATKASRQRTASGATSADNGVVVFDPIVNKICKYGKLLGKGGFAQCYEFKEAGGEKVYCVKVIDKEKLKGKKEKEKFKLRNEISIHSTMEHEHVVKFVRNFEDRSNYYIVLEKCSNKTMLELVHYRKTLTEPEARYYMKQICAAVEYLHTQGIIHRDLKLGNFLISDDMQIKLADFGLANFCNFSKGQRRYTICGTPNYIAPEVLQSPHAHWGAVDVWSIGVSLYAMLIGKPPFETKEVQTTYDRIKKNYFRFPKGKPISEPAKELITWCLRADPMRRPTVKHILQHPWMQGWSPTELTRNALRFVPHECENYKEVLYTNTTALTNAPTTGMENNSAEIVSSQEDVAKPTVKTPEEWRGADYAALGSNVVPSAGDSKHRSLVEIHKLMSRYRERAQAEMKNAPAEKLESGFHPSLSVSKWMEKEAGGLLSFELSDGTTGIIYRDRQHYSKMVQGKDPNYVYLIDKYYYMRKGAKVERLNTDDIPTYAEKQVEILQECQQVMNERLRSNAVASSGDEAAMKRTPHHIRIWYKTKVGIFFLLSDGTVQMNFFNHHKIILSHYGRMCTHIDNRREWNTYITISALSSSNETVKQLVDYMINLLRRVSEELAGPDANKEN